MEQTVKTCEHFNDKWKHHLEKGHYGMAINHEDVIAYMDKEFEREEAHNPGFIYSQIKVKFGMARVYVDNTGDKDQCFKWEEEINNILNKT